VSLLHLVVLRGAKIPTPLRLRLHAGHAAPAGARLAAPSLSPHRGSRLPEAIRFGGAPGELLAQCAEEGGRQDAMRGRKENGGGDNV